MWYNNAMIDNFFYKMFSLVDDLFDWIVNLYPKPKPKKQTDPVKVTTIEEVEALTAGTSYITPSGIINTR